VIVFCSKLELENTENYVDRKKCEEKMLFVYLLCVVQKFSFCVVAICNLYYIIIVVLIKEDLHNKE